MSSNRHKNSSGTRRNIVRMLVLLFCASVIVNIAGGCTATSRHKFLTIVFTGVPPLGGEAEEEITKPDQTAPVPAIKPEGVRPVNPVAWVHGPYGAKECNQCHNISQSSMGIGNKSHVQRASSPTIPTNVGEGLENQQQLCVSCHKSHGPDYASAHSLSLHKPSESGFCTACHQPHQSPRRYMLLGANNRELCLRCHLESELQLVGAHGSNPEADCLGCHNAHLGTTSARLKSQDNELSLLYQADKNE